MMVQAVQWVVLSMQCYNRETARKCLYYSMCYGACLPRQHYMESTTKNFPVPGGVKLRDNAIKSAIRLYYAACPRKSPSREV